MPFALTSLSFQRSDSRVTRFRIEDFAIPSDARSVCPMGYPISAMCSGAPGSNQHRPRRKFRMATLKENTTERSQQGQCTTQNTQPSMRCSQLLAQGSGVLETSIYSNDHSAGEALPLPVQFLLSRSSNPNTQPLTYPPSPKTACRTPHQRVALLPGVHRP